MKNCSLASRGRDAGRPAPPAQIRTSGFPAYGSYLGWMASKRTLLDAPPPVPGTCVGRPVSVACAAVGDSPWSRAFPPGSPRLVALPCSNLSWVSGRRWRACALATVRRSNCTCGFPAYSFHEDSCFRDATDGINPTRFTSPYSPYNLVAGNCRQPPFRQRRHRCERIRRTIQPSSRW